MSDQAVRNEKIIVCRKYLQKLHVLQKRGRVER